MNNQSGSALLLVIFVTALLVIATTTSWYAASLLHDASLVRQQSLQRKQAVEGLLTYAAAVAADHFDIFCTASGVVPVYEGNWVCGDGAIYYGRVLSNKTSQGLKLVAELKDGTKSIASLSLCLQCTDKDSKVIQITEWGAHGSAA